MAVTGRPVDIEIVPRAHAILSASSAERWLVCTPSARIEESLQDSESTYASEGTAAHSFAELTLRRDFAYLTDAEFDAGYAATEKQYAESIEFWEASDWEAIDDYVAYVHARVEALGGVAKVEVIIEAHVDYSRYAQGGFGTSDALLIAEEAGVIEAIDLKFGKGVPVYAEGNPQPRLYCLGGFLGIKSQSVRRAIKTFRMVIHQPRLGNISEAEMTRDEMVDWAENVVRPQAEKAWRGEGKAIPTDKGCRFCKASPNCRARMAQNVLIARQEFEMNMKKEVVTDASGTVVSENLVFDPDKYLADPAEMAAILPKLDQWINWVTKAKEFALVQARDNGITIPGYKVVRGRQTRRWREGVDVAADLQANGVDKSLIFTEPAVKSVAQMEKALGKKEFAQHEPRLVTKPLGTPTLVQSIDSRPAIDPVAEAKAEFAAAANK